MVGALSGGLGRQKDLHLQLETRLWEDGRSLQERAELLASGSESR